MNTSIANNPVFQNIQVGEKHESTTGIIIYANKYSGVSPIAMPKEIKDILDSNVGTIGTNPIIQLKNKLAALPNGPWYIDCRNGLLYIHNKKFNEKPVHNYVYQSENGEVLSLSFETQRRTKSLGHSIGGGIDPFSKDIVGVSSNVKSPTPGPGTKEVKKTTGSRFKVVAAIDATRVVNPQAEMTRLKIETPRINKTLKKKKAAQRKFIESQYTAYKKGNTISKQFSRSVAAAKNPVKDKWARNIYSKLDPHERVDLSSKVAQEWRKSHNRNTILKLVRDYFGYGKHTLITQYWKEQWVDPTTYTGNNTFQGPALNLSLTDTTGTRSKYNINLANTYLARMRQDPHIKVLSSLTVSNPYEDPNNPHGKYYKPPRHYRVKVFRLAYGRGQVDSSQIVTDWLIRLISPNASNNTSRGISGNTGRSFDVSNYTPGLLGNSGRSVTEKKLVVNLRVIGRPSLESSQIIHIENVGKKWSGDYYIKSCSHDMSTDMGYTCTLELNKNGEKAEIESTTTKLSTDKVVKDIASTNNNSRNSSRTTNNPTSSNKEDKSYKREYYSTSKVTVSKPKSQYKTKKSNDKH